MLDKLRSQLYETSFLGLGIMAGPDLQAFLHATRSPRAFVQAGWRVGFHAFDLATRRQGAVVDTPDGELTIRARRGTVLAAGGFPADVDRRRELFPRTPTGREHWTLADGRRFVNEADGYKTDAHARVLNAAGDPVPGLYAAGCDQASVMGGYYPSGGINIGPALTFGYIAGRHCAGVTDYENPAPVPQNDGV